MNQLLSEEISSTSSRNLKYANSFLKVQTEEGRHQNQKQTCKLSDEMFRCLRDANNKWSAVCLLKAGFYIIYSRTVWSTIGA